MVNEEIRATLKSSGVRQWMVAEALEVNESAFSRKLRRELSPEAKTAVLKAIERLAEKLEQD